MAEKRYTLAAGKSDGDLIDTVNRLIEEGWSPIGGPLIAHQEGEPILLQAVIRPPKAKPKKVLSLR